MNPPPANKGPMIGNVYANAKKGKAGNKGIPKAVVVKRKKAVKSKKPKKDSDNDKKQD